MSRGCCQGFLVWPPGCGSWCCYEQTQKINLLIQQSLLARYPQPFTIRSLSLYLLLTVGEWKSHILSLFQLSLQLRVAIRYIFLAETWGNVCWQFWKYFLSSKRKKSRALASCLWTWLHEDVRSGSGAAILQIWGKNKKQKRNTKQDDQAKGRKTLAQLSHLNHPQSSLDLFVQITDKL